VRGVDRHPVQVEQPCTAELGQQQLSCSAGHTLASVQSRTCRQQVTLDHDGQPGRPRRPSTADTPIAAPIAAACSRGLIATGPQVEWTRSAYDAESGATAAVVATARRAPEKRGGGGRPA
jgi:hypothetical protein